MKLSRPPLEVEMATVAWVRGERVKGEWRRVWGAGVEDMDRRSREGGGGVLWGVS